MASRSTCSLEEEKIVGVEKVKASKHDHSFLCKELPVGGNNIAITFYYR